VAVFIFSIQHILYGMFAQMVTFFVGLLMLIFSFVAVYFIERNSAVLFLLTTSNDIA